jgi:hypothetical protein
MSKEYTLKNAKHALIDVYDMLQRAFKSAQPEEQIFIEATLDSIEKSVNQLEALEEMLPIWKATKDKNQDIEIIEE